MGIEQGWPTRKPWTRKWLIENIGDAVPAGAIAEATEVGGSVASDAWWVGENEPWGFPLSDAAIDWIELGANGKRPKLADFVPASTS